MFKYFKTAKWAEPPQWKIEYFGKATQVRPMSSEEIAKKYKVTVRFLQEYYMRNLASFKNDVVVETKWEWRDWSGEKRFPSEKAALKAFRKKGLVRQIPYVEYRAVCVFAGRSKDAARQAEIEVENATRQEYREHYIEHLEERLAKLKEDVQALPS